MFSLVRGNNYYLLTADTEVMSLERLIAENGHQEFQQKLLVVGQLPHHGSAKNNCDVFWNSLIKAEERFAVASAGHNMKYQHPHFTVLKTFFSNGYTISCTNLVHGSLEFLEYLKELKATSDRLDTVSTLIDKYSAGEKSFNLV